MPSTSPGSVREVFGAALRLGLTSFGGPVAHLGYFRREYVERRRWLDEAAFADLIALVQLLPGPASSELGIAIGTRRAGMAGGIAAWLGFTLPSAIALTLFGLLASRVDLTGAGWVHGLELAAVAVVATAVWQMASTLTPDWRRRAIAVVAAAVSLALAVPAAQVAVILAGAAIGLVALEGRPAGGDRVGVEGVRDAGRVPGARVGVAALVLFAVLLVGLPIARAAGGGQAVVLVDAFYRSGALVFGGGHVVLPLLHATTVDAGWVSDDAFLAGYGAAQAVPGPLFTFSAYLGTVALVPPNGVPGAILALLAMFLPAFLLVFGVLPFWDRLRGQSAFGSALAGINAAVVGILFAALVTPVATTALLDPVDVLLAALATAALLTRRVPPIAVVAALALVGEAISLAA